MRALNPTVSKTIAKLNSNKSSQRNQTTTESKSLDGASSTTSTHGPPHALTATATSRPRPSSRQSTTSSSFSAISTRHTKTGFQRLPSLESLVSKPPRPTIITRVTPPKSSRPAPLSALNHDNNNSPGPSKALPTPSSISTRPPSSLSAARPPLRHRDQNASQMTTKATPMSRNVKVTMPYERSPNPNGGRPQMPTLSAAAARGTNKLPITPKIATKLSPAPTLAANTHTPMAKRVQRPANANLTTAAPSRSTPQPEEEPTAFLGNNITPRSAKRQSRVDSANSTPNGTPNPERNDGWDRDAKMARAVSPVGHESDISRRPLVSFSTISLDPYMPPKQEVRADLNSKFFHASDARASHQAPPKPPALAKAPSFFYANGNKAEGKSSGPPSQISAPSQKASHDNLASKFVYANGTPDLKPSSSAGPSRPGSVISMASKAPTSRPGTSSHGGTATNPAPRPISPVKLVQPPHTTQSKGASLASIATNRPPPTSAPQLGPPVGLRRTSSGTIRSNHSRTSSLVLGDTDAKHAFTPSGPSSPLASPMHPPLASPLNPPLSLASIIQAAEEFGEDESIASPDDSHSEIHSPNRSTHSGDIANDLVANARRERKVQDLQITNASLEAINRTLERQLRKQTAELRRYRRLSRAGHLSTVSSVASSRVVSEALSVSEGIDGLPLSDLEEEVSEEDFVEEDSLSDTDSASESLSPSLIAERDARHMSRDEKRLQLDLSKHQELLIDSQKINQSIKRCLDWTEELIKEGKKALEYSVRVSDVEIPGPRVLAPLDEEEDLTQTSVNFDPNTTMEDSSTMAEEAPNKVERIMPLEPKLAGWQPDPVDFDSILHHDEGDQVEIARS